MQDHVFLVTQANLGSGPAAEEDLVARLDVYRLTLAVVADLPVTDRLDDPLLAAFP